MSPHDEPRRFADAAYLPRQLVSAVWVRIGALGRSPYGPQCGKLQVGPACRQLTRLMDGRSDAASQLRTLRRTRGSRPLLRAERLDWSFQKPSSLISLTFHFSGCRGSPEENLAFYQGTRLTGQCFAELAIVSYPERQKGSSYYRLRDKSNLYSNLVE